MKRYVYYFLPLLVLTLLIINIISCSEEKSDPTSSSTQSSDQMTNFWAARGYYDQFGAYAGTGFFEVNVPAGEYLLKYTVWNSGTYYLVLQTAQSAIINVGLHQGDSAYEVSLKSGQILSTGGATLRSDPVTLYSWPGSTSPVWSSVFAESASSQEVVVIKSGKVNTGGGIIELPDPQTMVSPTPTPTPATTPVGTPVP